MSLEHFFTAQAEDQMLVLIRLTQMGLYTLLAAIVAVIAIQTWRLVKKDHHV